MKKSGFVGIIGRPNVGKSTLLNALVGEKLAGISARPQTTRGTIRGIISQDEGQIVYMDTPGIHRPKDPLGEWMMGEIDKCLESVELVYFVVLPKKITDMDKRIVERIKKSKVPCFLLVNQIDKYSKAASLPTLAYYQEAADFKEFIPISAAKEIQLDLLVEKTFEYLPENPPYFPEDQISDQQERFFIQELIREKIFRHMREELPYSASVIVEQCKPDEKKIMHVHATIVVEKDSQRKMMIGKGGENLKKLGTLARQDLEVFLEAKVFLQLWVKTMQSWKKDKQALKKLGYK